MDFALTDEQQQVCDVMERIARDHIDKAARVAEEMGTTPAYVIHLVSEVGLLWPIAEDHGGAGAFDDLTVALGIEALASGDPAIAVDLVRRSGFAEVITGLGTQGQQATFLRPLAANPKLQVGVALHEGYGRAPGEYRTTVSRNADGSWSVAGSKQAVPFGREALHLVVIGRDETGALRGVIVDGSDPGITVDNDSPILGLTAAPSADLTFACRVDEDRLLGGVDADGTDLARIVSGMRIATAFIALGLARRAVAYASAYAAERPAFGKTIAAFQGPAFMLADADIQIRAARLEAIATLLDTGEGDPCVDGSPLARVFLSCAGWSWRPCVRPFSAAFHGRWP